MHLNAILVPPFLEDGSHKLPGTPRPGEAMLGSDERPRQIRPLLHCASDPSRIDLAIEMDVTELDFQLGVSRGDDPATLSP
jgi:hypothetical protein